VDVQTTYDRHGTSSSSVTHGCPTHPRARRSRTCV
jgi:hypothetical protein